MLDFLIHEPEPAVLLHDAGIYVLVPSPQGFAIHKLIVSRRRQQSAAKQDKDVRQSAALLDVLNEKRPYELKSAWQEAYGRGPTWQNLLVEGLGSISASTRDKVLRTIERPRNIIPGLNLEFAEPVPRCDFNVVTFIGEANKAAVRCAMSREALDDNFGATTGSSNEQRLDKFRKNRSSNRGDGSGKISQLASRRTRDGFDQGYGSTKTARQASKRWQIVGPFIDD